MNIKQPLISIVIPVYNVEHYIDSCLASIKNQTYKNIEIIIVEDCSTDSSAQILQSHLEDERITLIQHNKNSGLSAARNTGIKAATGEYIMFVDSDDIVDIRLVQSCINCALDTGADVVTYDFTPFQDGLACEELPSLPLILNFEPIAQDNDYFHLPHFAWLKFIRSTVIKSFSLHFPIGLHYEDWPFHWHLGLATKKIYHLPVGFYLYRQRSSSITGSTGEKLLDLFIIHSQVMMLVEKYNAYDIKDILATKIRQSHWVILTRIDSKLLPDAFNKAKKAEQSMKRQGYKSDLTIRDRITLIALHSPNSFGLPALDVIRKLLNKKMEIRAKINSN